MSLSKACSVFPYPLKHLKPFLRFTCNPLYAEDARIVRRWAPFWASLNSTALHSPAVTQAADKEEHRDANVEAQGTNKGHTSRFSLVICPNCPITSLNFNSLVSSRPLKTKGLKRLFWGKNRSWNTTSN